MLRAFLLLNHRVLPAGLSVAAAVIIIDLSAALWPVCCGHVRALAGPAPCRLPLDRSQSARSWRPVLRRESDHPAVAAKQSSLHRPAAKLRAPGRRRTSPPQNEPNAVMSNCMRMSIDSVGNKFSQLSMPGCHQTQNYLCSNMHCHP